MFKRRKEESTLYKGFLQKQNAILAGQDLSDAAPCREKKKSGKVAYRGTAEICVTSFFHGCGATYLSEILAVFLGSHKGSTCLVETKGLAGELLKFPMDVVTYPCDISDIYKQHYDFIVRDIGIYDALSKDAHADFLRSDFKCIVSWPDEQSLKRLAFFADTTEHADSFSYFFNMVPKDRTREILSLMEDYSSVILPCTSLTSLGKELVTDLYAVFGKG